MSYRAEKEKIENQIHIIKLVALCVVLGVLLFFCVFSAFRPPATWKYYVGKPKVSRCRNGEMRIHFLDVGQGDSALIELPDGKVALIDGGDTSENTEKVILRYLNKLRIKKIDYLIVTHPDSDHCGSLRTIVQQKKILNAYLPAAKPEKEGESYAGFYQELLDEECNITYASRTVDLSSEGYTFTFLYPYSTNLENVEFYDGSSSIVWLDYMGVSAIFMGDEGVDTEERLMRDDRLGLLDNLGVDLQSTEILKVGHHGSNTSTSLEFLQYLQVAEGVISCGANNQYGHPTDTVLANVAAAGANVYRTDENGTVMITVDDEGAYEVKTSK